MAPFAAAYPSEGTHDGPVHVRLGDGAEDKLMDWAASEISVLRTQTPAAQQLQEMDWDVWEGEAQNEGTLVVIDTNYLLAQLPALRALHDLLAASSLPSRPTLYIPRIVLSELDSLKKSTRNGNGGQTIAQSARAAAAWLMDVLPTTGAGVAKVVIRGQRKDDTLIETRVSGDNDSLILDACLFAQSKGEDSILLSNDNVLCLRARSEGIVTVSSASRGNDVPLEILRQISPTFAKLLHPGKSRSSHREEHTVAVKPPTIPQPSAVVQDIGMECDEIDLPPLTPLPPPIFLPAHTVEQVLQQVDQLATYLVALALYRHLVGHLSSLRPQDRGVWQSELGDWRDWDMRRCLEMTRIWWIDGGVEHLCAAGLAKVGGCQPSPSTSRQATRTSSSISTSKWAPATTLPVPPPPVPSSRSLDKQLRSIHSSLPILREFFATLHVAPLTAIRVGVMLEAIALVLLGVYGGALGSSISIESEVKALSQQWCSDLERVGLKLSAT